VAAVDKQNWRGGEQSAFLRCGSLRPKTNCRMTRQL
jgi:hypothetical protein